MSDQVVTEQAIVQYVADSFALGEVVRMAIYRLEAFDKVFRLCVGCGDLLKRQKPSHKVEIMSAAGRGKFSCDGCTRRNM